MENIKSSAFSKLMSILFIILGVFLGFYSFFIQGATRNVGGTLPWNNITNYLNSTFWNALPNTYDIITALYGTGDEGSIYTQHWSGYTSGSCLNAGMNVEYTGVIPTTLNSNTIYVLTSGTYLISNTIFMKECSALITSGTVTLQKTNDFDGLVISGIHYSIIDNIHIDGNMYGNNGLSVFSGGNNTIHDILSTNNGGHGISIFNTQYFDINTAEISNNMDNGIYVIATQNSTFSYIDAHHNNQGNIYLGQSSYNNYYNISGWNSMGGPGITIYASGNNIFNNIFSFGNKLDGIKISYSDNNTGINIFVGNNGGIAHGGGIKIDTATNNSLTNVEIYNNMLFGLYLESASYNKLYNFHVYDNNIYGIDIRNNSNYNTLSGIVIHGTTMFDGLHIEGSNNTTITALQSYNNTKHNIYLSGITSSVFTNIVANNSQTAEGIYITNSMENTFSGGIASGNYLHGIYITGVSNSLFQNIEICNTTGGFTLYYTSGVTLDRIYTHHMLGTGSSIYMLNTRYSIIQNSTIFNTGTQNSIVISGGHNNIISGTMLSGAGIGILLKYTFNNIIRNSSSYNNTYRSLYLFETTGHTIQNFSGYGIGNSMYEENTHGLFLTTLYDTLTQNNNYIIFESHTHASVTGTTTVGATYNIPFDELSLSSGNSINIKGATGFTVSGAIWNGMLYIPTSVVGTKAATATETGIVQVGTILDTIEAVTGTTYLTMHGGTGTIMYQVPGSTSGQYLKIFKSNDGNTRTANTLMSGCVVNNSNICTFTFRGEFKLFAFGVPTNLSFTGYTLNGTQIQSGGYYNTGVYIIFTGSNISGALLNGTSYTSGTLITGNATYIFSVSDLAGNSGTMNFTIDTIYPLVTGNYPTSGLNITGGNNITFFWSGLDTNMSGYTLYINSTGYQVGNIDNYLITLQNGTYTRYVVAKDLAGNTGTSAAATFTISTPLTGTVTITGITYTGFTNNTMPVILQTNQPAIFTITGDITGAMLPPYTGIVNPGTTHYLDLTDGDGVKTIYVTFSTGSETPVTITKTITLDTTAPAVGLVSPASGTTAEGTFSLIRGSAGADAVGLSGYQYIISNTNTFATITTSGYTSTTGAIITAGTLNTSTIYYRYVKTIDRLGNIGTSNVQSFIYSGTIDTTPYQFSFNDIENARLDRTYMSNTVTITGMTPGIPVLASINRGALYISGNLVGITGYVQNGRTVKIELNSSDDYNKTVSSTLTIGGVSDTFSVTTMEEDEDIDSDYEDIDTNLSNTEKLQIIAIFEALKDVYAGDKEQEFFNTFMVMLENKMNDYDEDDNEWSTLKYLYDLINQYYKGGDFGGDNINTTRRIINGIYTAPNGKKYPIKYDSSKQRFTSSNFVVPKYFPTLDTLKYIIDINNPAGSKYANSKPILARRKNAAIDGTRQTSPYTAPNKKVFYFFKDINGRYSSYTFTSERYFDSLEEVKEFIYNTNK